MTKRAPFIIGDISIDAGSRDTVDLVAGQLYTHEDVHMPVHVVHGKRDGPTLFVSAAIHGDELNGIEIVRRLVTSKALTGLRGTLIAVPVVNVLGVMHQSRYLPDRRDLNRCFPGSAGGSLASRLAHLFMEEVVERSTHGIDLHTGAVHRSNLPQVRAKLDDETTLNLARAFGAQVLLDAQIRDGSLRAEAAGRGIPMLLYEAGEALRFEETSIRLGLRGVLSVMRTLGMLPARKARPVVPFIARSSTWVRAPASGIFRAAVALGSHVAEGDVLGRIADPFGGRERPVKASAGGLVIGRTNLPLVHEGDALYHIGRVTKPEAAAARAERIEELAYNDPLLSQSPPIA